MLGCYAMVILQMLPTSSEPGKVSFLDTAEQFLRYILQASPAGKSIDQIHIVFEENSLKKQTQQKRGDTGIHHKIHIQSEIAIPKAKKWNKFLRDSGIILYHFIIENAGG